MKSRTEKGNAPEVAATEASSEVSQTTKKGTIVSDSTVAPTNSQPVFNFGDNQVRVIVRDGNPWFVAADVCAVLGVKNHRDSLMHLDDDEKGVVLNDTLGGKQQISVVNESGLYALVLRSRKPEAKKFTKWVTSEVLPSIRKTGQYTATPYTVQPSDTLNEAQQIALRAMLESNVKRLPQDKQAAAMIKGWSKLKAHFGVPYRQIPASEFAEALSIIARHVSQWELVDEAPSAGTVNDMVAEWVRKIEEPNGYPAILFMPLVQAVQRKMGRTRTLPAGQMLVDRNQLAAIYTDLGKLRSRIDAMGMPAQDTPPSWWQQQVISP